MGVLSKGITLAYGENVLTNLMEIPELGAGEIESVEITTLADGSRKYMDGLKNNSESIDFKFLYEKEQFSELNALDGSQLWKVSLPDGSTCSFNGSCSVRLEGASVGAALTYVLNVRPTTELVWA